MHPSHLMPLLAVAACMALPAVASANSEEPPRHSGTAKLVGFCDVNETAGRWDGVFCTDFETAPEVDRTLIDIAYPHLAHLPLDDGFAIVRCGERGSTAVGRTPPPAVKDESVASLAAAREAALKACDGDLGLSGGGDSIEDMLGSDPFGSGGNTPSSAAMDCRDRGPVNPYARGTESGGARTPQQALHKETTKATLDAIREWQWAKNMAIEATEVANGSGDKSAIAHANEAKAAAEEALHAVAQAADANDAVEDAKSLEDAQAAAAKVKEAVEKVTKFVEQAREAAEKALKAISGMNIVKKPSGSSTPTTQPGPASGGSPCTQQQQFIWECEQAGWKTGPCQEFRDMLNGCVDGKLARYAEDAAPCGPQRFSPEQLEAAMLKACGGLVGKWAPGGGPCGMAGSSSDGPRKLADCVTKGQSIDGDGCAHEPETVKPLPEQPDCPPPPPHTPPPPCGPTGDGKSIVVGMLVSRLPSALRDDLTVAFGKAPYGGSQPVGQPLLAGGIPTG